MRRRLLWLLGGWAIGTATAAWLRRRLRKGVRRYAPEHLRQEASDRTTDLIEGVRRITREIVAATREGADEARSTRLSLDHRSPPRRHNRPVRVPLRRP